MKISIGITRALTTAALLGLMVLAVLGFRAQEKDMQSLREHSQEVIYWSTSQGEAELGRFLTVLAAFIMGTPEITANQVNKRFDILWSRVEVFRQGMVGRRIRTYDGELGAIVKLHELLEKYEDAIVNISHDDPVELHKAVLADFMAADKQLRKLSGRLQLN